MINIVIAPNKILREEAKPVKKINEGLKITIKEMVNYTKKLQDPEGVGLAATQIGISEQFFIAKLGEKFVTVVNPTIIFYSKRTKKLLEGCLSVPDYYGEVARPAMIKVRYTNLEGQTIQETLRGTNALIFQHEYDHLHGRLFTDLVLSQKTKMFKVVGKDKTGNDIFEEVIL